MEQLIIFIQNNIEIAPYIILGLLLLAGLNLPVSEDLMIFTGAILSAKNPEMLYTFFTCIFIGAYLSDLMCYWIGRVLGQKIWEINFFKKMASEKRVEKLSSFYKQYGAITLVVGRFIPFGVRNGLFLTAGMGKMNFLKFSFYDFLACVTSNITFFYLYYNFGESVVDYIKRGNIIIFGVALATLIFFATIRKKMFGTGP